MIKLVQIQNCEPCFSAGCMTWGWPELVLDPSFKANSQSQADVDKCALSEYK